MKFAFSIFRIVINSIVAFFWLKKTLYFEFVLTYMYKKNPFITRALDGCLMDSEKMDNVNYKSHNDKKI